MNILEKIVESKKQEVAFRKRVLPDSQLKGYPLFGRKCNSLKSALSDNKASGIIAEFKQKSPSKGEINLNADVEKVTLGYARAGATGLSVLTDYQYFGGTNENLLKAREVNPDIPILRKDFIIDKYQVIEAKAFGADVILLIAACLEKEQAMKLTDIAKSLGMEVLMEFHSVDELELLNDLVDIAGINNRNLKTFKVNIETSVELAKLIDGKFIKISESGLSDSLTIKYLKNQDFKGFLIGENFMKTPDPGEACRQFILEL